MTHTKDTKFAMYDAILSQPSAVCSVINRGKPAIESLARRVADAKSTTLIGIGSSLHAAQLAVALWRECLPGKHVSAEHAYDTANGLGILSPETLGADASQHLAIVISHRGKKKYSREALHQLQEMGVRTCLITGEGVEVSSNDVELHLTTTPQEKSSAHTSSLLGSFALCAGVVEVLGDFRNRAIHELLADAVQVGLSSEQAMIEASRSVAEDTRQIWLVGSGSDATVAREIALKIKETSYVPSEGMSIEEFLHGPFQCLDSRDRLIILDTQGHSTERARTLQDMASCVGVPIIGISNDEGSETNCVAEQTTMLVRSPIRTLNSMSALVALQLFTYHLALHRGTNPDGFRLEDPRFKRASELITL